MRFLKPGCSARGEYTFVVETQQKASFQVKMLPLESNLKPVWRTCQCNSRWKHKTNLRCFSLSQRRCICCHETRESCQCWFVLSGNLIVDAVRAERWWWWGFQCTFYKTPNFLCPGCWNCWPWSSHMGRSQQQGHVATSHSKARVLSPEMALATEQLPGKHLKKNKKIKK